MTDTDPPVKPTRDDEVGPESSPGSATDPLDAIDQAEAIEALKVIDPALFRQVMGGFATGVSVITSVTADGVPRGMTANSLTSVSLDPVLLLVCFERRSETLAALRESGVFVVNLLDDDGQELSVRFARPGEQHFDDLEHETTADGVPILHGGLGHLECTVEDVHEGGDHLIVVGRVRHGVVREGRPLIYYRGRYERLG